MRNFSVEVDVVSWRISTKSIEANVLCVDAITIQLQLFRCNHAVVVRKILDPTRQRIALHPGASELCITAIAAGAVCPKPVPPALPLSYPRCHLTMPPPGTIRMAHPSWRCGTLFARPNVLDAVCTGRMHLSRLGTGSCT